MGPFAAAAIPAAIGAVGSLIGGSAANTANAREAQRNRDFQALMSNTQYQRAVRDMRRAGLNPALAYGQGGAGNLGGSQARYEDVVSPAIGRGIEAATARQQLRLVQEQANKTEQEKLAQAWQNKLLSMETRRMQEFTGELPDGRIDPSSAFAASLQAERLRARAQALGISGLRAESEFWDKAGDEAKWLQFLLQAVRQLRR